VGALAKRRERRAAVEAGVARGATRGGAARASEDAMGQTRGRTRGGAARASEDAMGQTRGRRLDVDARGTGGSTRVCGGPFHFVRPFPDAGARGSTNSISAGGSRTEENVE